MAELVKSKRNLTNLSKDLTKSIDRFRGGLNTMNFFEFGMSILCVPGSLQADVTAIRREREDPCLT